jgi:uncharacterized protein (DUF4213/DUF364 family)
MRGRFVGLVARGDARSSPINYWRDGMVLDETLEILKTLYGKELDITRIEKIVFGIFFSGVKLSDGSGGVAYTPTADLHSATCCPTIVAGRPAPVLLKGMTVFNALSQARESALGNVVKLVIMNALSSRFITSDRYHVVYDTDSIDLIDLKRAGRIGMVGAFIPFLKVLKSIPGIDLTVVEQKKETLNTDEMRFYAPTEQAKQVLSCCDTVIITGASIANGTIEDLLSLTRPGANVLVTGPTASILPDALFARNANIVSGVKITDPDLTIDLLSEGVGAHHLFNRCVRKINILKN